MKNIILVWFSKTESVAENASSSGWKSCHGTGLCHHTKEGLCLFIGSVGAGVISAAKAQVVFELPA